ncbi:transposase [Paenibacillus planticolens]|uniref:Transposase n=1 Tax=Paenibacillus planticolens TaxID=2654976 RepID=A0ABX1ZX81_9BACL|nr:transposase [Paenibacillus planticolens]NOV04288.1 transposase [Paenibacillus planticolens]
MSFMIVLLICLIPACMLIGAWLFATCRILFHLLAVVSAYAFGIITALAVYEILRDDTVFMTNIHAVFKNRLFLMSGAYLGSYGIYTLWIWLFRELRSE